MDELERYLARRAERRLFVLTIRERAQRDRSARLEFESGQIVARMTDELIEELSERGLRLHVECDGLVDVEDRMIALGWRLPERRGHSNQSFYFHQPLPLDDRPATFAAIARGAAAAILGTDEYLLTIEPQGRADVIGESAIYEGAAHLSLFIVGGFVVGAPIAILGSLAFGNALEAALVACVLVAIAAVYHARLPRLSVESAILRFLEALGESPVVEWPIIGSRIYDVVGFYATFVGVWLPIALAILITSAM